VKGALFWLYSIFYRTLLTIVENAGNIEEDNYDERLSNRFRP